MNDISEEKISLPSDDDEHFEKSRKQLKKKQKKRKHEPVYENLFKEQMLNVADQSIDEREIELENLVFGGEDDILEQLNSEKIHKKKRSKRKSAVIEENSNDEIGDDIREEAKNEENTKAAWVDDDDEKILVNDKTETYRKCHRSVLQKGYQKYKDYAREMFIKINGNPNWAKLDKKGDVGSSSESEDEFLKKTGDYLLKSKTLPKLTIDIRKCQNLTEQKSSSTVFKSVEFHPTSRVALTAGLNGVATLYQVDGKENSKIQSIYFEKFSIYTAHFSVDGTEIVVGSKANGHYFTYDMIEGKISKVPWEKGMEQMNVKRFKMSPDGKFIAIYGRYGNIHLVGSKSKEWICSLKMNGEVVAITFNNDGSRMYTHGSGGQVYVWDMSTRSCIHKFNDEGCIVGTALAMSPNEQYIATGSDSGVVNIYDSSSLLNSVDPKPLKVVLNLTTEITNLKFNCTSEILAMSSSHKKESARMVHFPSMTVFSNFPNQNRALNYVNSLDISPNSGYLMLGNNLGKVYLYRLRHYANY